MATIRKGTLSIVTDDGNEAVVIRQIQDNEIQDAPSEELSKAFQTLGRALSETATSLGYYFEDVNKTMSEFFSHFYNVDTKKVKRREMYYRRYLRRGERMKKRRSL